jgi:hypothetical protein
MWWSTKAHRGRSRRPLAEVVEPRILYSADLAAALLTPGLTEAANEPAPEQRSLTDSGEYTSSASPPHIDAAVASPAATPVAAQALYARAPLSFEANVGQAEAQTQFIARGAGYGIALSGGSAELTLGVDGQAKTVRLELQGALPAPLATAGNRQTGTSNYIVGSDPAAWYSDIANYGDVVYQSVYSGVDLHYYGNQRQLEYDFIVKPGADASAIALRFAGVSQSAIAANGDLVLTLGADGSQISFKAPVSYQDGPNGREAVASRYQLNADGSIGFALGAYDSSRTLVIDPVLSYASYFGTSGNEAGLGVATDASGAVYITGRTTNTLATNIGGGGGGDVYVAKFSADLSTLIYSTRIGGTGDEQGNAIAVDSTGAAVVTGWTKSSNFPTVSPNQGARSGSQDAFIFRLNAAGSALTFSTYYGNSGGSDSGNGVAIDAADNIYVAGEASAPGFLTIGIGGSLGLLGGDEAFVTKLNSAGVVQYSGLYGGNGTDYATGIAVDASGNAYIVGNTVSNNLPMVNSYDSSYDKKSDAFLAKINASGNAILYSTYIGSKEDDYANAVAIDASGNAYVAGQTNTQGGSSLTVTAGAFQTSPTDKTVGFVRVFNTNLSGAPSLIYASFLGGNSSVGADKGDAATGIAADALGQIYVVGTTDSANFPTTADGYNRNNGNGSGFFVVLNPAGTGASDLVYGTFFGSNGSAGNVVANGGRAVIVGTTFNGGLATPGAAQTGPAGGSEAIIASFQVINNAPVLNGANNLTSILEDAITSTGTLVSALIAGQVSDPNLGALTGIAVTAVNNTSGTWQYSLNGGGGWSSFGAPTDAAARLLAADAMTRVRFVPSANFSGAVAGLTFRAWDRATGTAGSTANTTTNGGNTAYSVATATSSIAVTAVNDAPVRTAGTVANRTVAEDSGLSSLGLGALAYSPGGGVDEAGQTLSYTVTAIPPAASGSIVLADGTTAVAAGSTWTLAELQGMQFSTFSNANGGPFTFSWSVTDDGGTANGGVNTLGQSLTITVTPVNDAPVLAGANNLGNIVEDTGANNGTLVSALIQGQVSDPDAGALTGIAVTGVDNSNGIWQYSRDAGFNWISFGNPSDAVARLLDADAFNRVRFVPNANFAGVVSGLTFRAWDDPSSGDGTTANATVNGGTSIFSAAAFTASVSVTPVNDAPVRTAGSVNNLTVAEDAPLTSLGLGALSYGPGGGADEAAQILSYSVTAVPSSSLGQVFLADGTTLVSPGIYTLAELRGMQFAAAANASGGPLTFSWRVQDDGGTAGAGVDLLNQSLTITVTAVNDAPVLSGANNLTAILEDTVSNNGTLVSALIAGQTSDIDGPASGIAVTGVDNTNGVWQFSLNGGGSWSALGAPSDANARLLSADAATRVRFVANADYSGTVSNGFTFRAWDGSSGTAGFTTSAAANGGVTAFSAQSASASITVTAVNDPPVRTAGVLANLTVLEDSGATSLGLSGLAYGAGGGAPEAGQTLSFTVTTVPAASLGQIVLADGVTVVTANTGYTLAELQGMQFRTAANANGGPAVFSWKVQDDGGTANGGVDSLSQSLTVSVAAVNDQPVRTTGTVANLIVLEDSGTTSLGLTGLGYGPGGAADESVQTLSYRVTAVPSAALGQIVLADGTTVVTANTPYSLAQLQGMQFKALANANGTAVFSWTAKDNAGIANGGVDTLSESLAISVTAVNDQPVRTAGSVANLTVAEDAGATSLGLGALAYAPGGGADEAGQLLSYTVTTIPAASLGQIVLANGTTVVTTNTAYTLAQLQGMQFKATANAVGTGSFSWTVQDNAGTANGGVDTLVQTLNITVGAVNDPPVLSTGAVTPLAVLEDSGTTGLGLGLVSYGPGGGVDEAGQTLSYTITSVPAAALGQIVLADGTTVVTASSSYSLAQLQGMQFKAAANANGTGSLTWNVRDNGGTAAGGVDTLAQSLAISVTAVNDAPVRTAGSASNLTVLEDSGVTSLGLGALAYGNGGGADEASQLLTYTVTAVPAAALGQIVLADGSTVVTSGTGYSLVQLRGMEFKAAANANGGPAVFSWRVQDNAGTANGGADMLAESLAITVTAVNDQPVRTAGAVNNLNVLETSGTTSLGLAGLAYGPGGGVDETGQTLAYTVMSVPPPSLGNVFLADGTTLVTANTTYTLAQLQGMQFTVSGTGTVGAADFIFQVKDSAGTANGGVDVLAQSLRIAVGAVNDPPVRTAGSVNNAVVLEDSGITSLGLAGLAYGNGGGADEASQVLSFSVTAVPAAALGQIVLADGTTVVTANTGYTLAQLRGMQFKTALNANGGPALFSWKVQDDGGTALGGIDTLNESLSISVTAVNDQPVRTAGTVGSLTVLEDSGTTTLGLGALAYTPGGGADEAAAQLLGYTVTLVPAASLGHVVLADGVTVVNINTSYTLAQLQGMQFRAAANANGTGSFSFSVQDNAGTANGGVDTLVQSLAITVTAVNDQPVRTAGVVSNLTVLEDSGTTSLSLGTLAYGMGGGADEAGQTLSFTVTAVPAASLGQIVLADGTTVVAVNTGYSLVQLQGMQFRAQANANGVASFSWKAVDSGGTTAGGVDTLNESLSITVSAVNDPPVRSAGAVGNLIVLEDTGPTSLGLAGLAYGNGGGADEASQGLSYTVTAVPAAALGQIVLADGATLVTVNTGYTLAQLQGMQFKAAGNANGGPAVFSWRVQDNGGTALGGVDSLSESLSINVNAVNDQPVRTAGAVSNLTVTEGSTTTSLGLSGLGYSPGGGADEAGQILSYTVTAVPAASLGQIVLADGTTPVTANTLYTLTQLQGMQFQAAANANGVASFSWKAVDDGGTATGGVDTLNETLSITVSAVNDAPVRTAGTVSDRVVLEDSGITGLGLGALSYGPGGGSDESAQVISYSVTSVPAAALGQIVLADGTTVVTANTSYTLAQLRGMQFKTAADANGGPAVFSWRVQDDGGTAFGGVDSLTESLSISVTAVNDQPARTGGSVNSLSVLEDSGITSLGLGLLAYSPGGGPDEATAQVLGYTVTGVPVAALGNVVLADGTTVVAANTSYTLAQLQGMQFKAAANANGTGSISWSVQDNAGTANGGIDTLAETLSISVTSVNDQPVRTAGVVANLTVVEDSGTTSLGLAALTYSAGGGADEAGQTLSFTVTAVPAASLGQIVLADGTTVVAANTGYTLAQLQGLQFKAQANANGVASFSWKVMDDGGTAAGGVDTLGETLSITVTAVNDPPVRTAGTSNNLIVLEDSGTTSLGLASLAYGPGGGADEASQVLSYTVTAVPAATLGQIVLADGTTIVTANTGYTLAQLQGMQFKTAAHANGGPALFSWDVEDNGSVGLADVGSLSESLTINVTPVNDPPVRAAGATNDLTVLETGGTTGLGLDLVSYTGGGGADEAGQALTYRVTLVPSASLGDVVLADGTTLVTANTGYTLAQLQGMQFRTSGLGNVGVASFSFSVTDDGGTANGGVDTLAQSLQITVSGVNDRPVRTAGNANDLVVLEDSGSSSLGLAGLVYGPGGGPDEAGQTLSYTVTAVPAAALGQIVLADGTTVVTANAAYTLAQLQGMQFRAAADAAGGPAVFSWKVQDDGGTAVGGVDTLNESLSITVTAVNDAPVRAAGTAAPLVVPEDAGTASLGLGAIAYGAGGGADEAGQTLTITVTAVPAASLGQIVLADGTTVVSAGTGYTLAQLQGMQFKAQANANSSAGAAIFSWSISDNGGTAAGGADTLLESLTINVTPVNDVPVRTAGTAADLTVLEDSGTTSLGLQALLYGPGGGTDESGQQLGYTVTAVPDAAFGSIVLADGTTVVTAGTRYTLAQLQGMQFRTLADANGGPAVFSWSVQDDGGTSSGGVDLLAESISISVTAVNDPPVGRDTSVQTPSAGAVVVFGTSDFAFSDTADASSNAAPNALLGIRVLSLPAGGVLSLDGAAVQAGQTIAAADIAAGKFRFTPAASGDTSFSFVVFDNGGTSNGGVNTDTTPRKLQIVVATVQSEPIKVSAPVIQAISEPAAAEATPKAAVVPQAAVATLAEPLAVATIGTGAPAQQLAAAQAPQTAPEPERRTVEVLSAERRSSDLLPPAPVFELGTISFANRAGISSTVYEQFLRSLHSQGFIDELDQLRDEIRKDFNLEKTFAISATGVTFGVSFLYVLWLVRGGVLMSSYLAALPAWRVLDPLPVLSRMEDEESDDEEALGAGAQTDDPLHTLKGY